MIFDRHDIVVVPFPFHVIDVTKRRPALVVSSRDFNTGNGWTVIAMVTTAKRSSWPSDFAIVEWSAAGLARECRVRLRFQTVPNRIIDRRLGRLAAIDRLSADRQFAMMLAE